MHLAVAWPAQVGAVRAEEDASRLAVESGGERIAYETMVRLLGDEVVERQPPLALAKLARAVLHLLLRVIHRCRDGDDLRRGRALQLGPLAEAHDEHPGQRRGHLLDRRLVPFSVFLKHGEHRLTSLQWLRRRRLPVENAALRQTRDQLLDVFLLAGFVKLVSTKVDTKIFTKKLVDKLAPAFNAVGLSRSSVFDKACSYGISHIGWGGRGLSGDCS
mmetsp:Transcript_15915/g.33837  ORF Transcript_15915/g.33837 Transcript_15915/m.33837 type:complete len:217 (-) Transcript_15915:10-660(-)